MTTITLKQKNLACLASIKTKKIINHKLKLIIPKPNHNNKNKNKIINRKMTKTINNKNKISQ